MRVRKDQKGFTIVELLIAVAILSIVVASVCGFILVGSRSYAAANSDINVQQSAQLSLNQMSDVLIDTTRSVNYAAYDAGGNPTPALKDSEFAFTPEDKSLIMYNGVAVVDPSGGPDIIEEGSGNKKNYHFYWDKSEETLFYAENDATLGVAPQWGDASADWVELTTHVTDFSVDLSQVEEKRVVMLALTFLDGKKEYVTSNNVTIRNKVGVNDAELAPLSRRKTLSVTPRDANVILEPGETYHFSTPRVTGENVVDRSVTWSFDLSNYIPASGTFFTDAANGILQVSTEEPAGKLEVMITTNATDSEGNHASFTPLTVYIKRVSDVQLRLSQSSDTATDDTKKEVGAGEEFTITASVLRTEDKLGKQCSGCTADITHDLHVVDWTITQGGDLVEEVDVGNCKQDAKYRVKADAQEGTIRIEATSELSRNRLYDEVTGFIELTVVKGNTDLLWLGGDLNYSFDGDGGGPNNPIGPKQDVIDQGVPEWRYVTCIRAVDQSKEDPDPDRILLYISIDGGADFRIVPSLLDLDLNKEYRLYVQAMSPVNKTNLKNGNDHQEDPEQEIWDEYINNLNPRFPYGYQGKKYVYGRVYYGDLKKPTGIWRYNGEPYEGTDIFYDPVNVFYNTDGILIGHVEPEGFKSLGNTANPEEIRKMMTYSVYEGEGDDRSHWKALYWFDDAEGVMAYKGSKEIGEGAGKLGIGNGPGKPEPLGMFLRVQGGDKRKVCGTYHIVPGFCYDNSFFRGTANYRIVGWDGFSDCEYAPGKEFAPSHKMKYYEFDDSVIHAEINSEFTMDIKDDWFEGQVNFPLPKEMLENPTLFPNPYETEVKSTTGSLRVEALKTGSIGSNERYKTFTYVNYRYIPLNKNWEVEPVEIRFDTGAKKIYTHSYGTYVCGEYDSKWEKSTTKSSSTTERELVCNLKPFSHNGRNDYQAFFPLPTDEALGFPFVGDVKEITGYELEYFDGNMQSQGKLSDLTVTCEKNEAQQYTIRLAKKEKKAPDWSGRVTNHKITVTSYGTYTWKPGDTMWTRTDGLGNSVTFETDFVANLEGVMINNQSCKMHFPLPSESEFPFKNSGEKISCDSAYMAYAMTDRYAENVIELQYGVDIKYERSGNIHKITFCNRYGNDVYGTFTCSQNGTRWTN